MRVALVQFNPTVADLAGNADRMIGLAREAARNHADLIVFSELCLVGYPPMDLLERSAFIEAVEDATAYLLTKLPAGVGILFGAPVRTPHDEGKPLQNAALLVEDGQIVATIPKRELPTYDVFDELRHFEPGGTVEPVFWRDVRLGIHICEDMWEGDPVEHLGERGVDLFVNISASPFAIGKVAERDGLIKKFCSRFGKPFIYVNQVGANTEILFDGNSTVFGSNGELHVRLRAFTEDVAYWDGEPISPARKPGDDVDDVLDALVMGIRDYVEKTDAFDRVIVGLSGGIDSALTCALAVEALGPDRVVGITMPSKYSSPGSILDSETLAGSLGIELHEISIEPAVDAFEGMLEELFEGTAPGIAEENIQARTRGLTLMALCNKFGYLLLTTGNKSELATGYATLYGDMSGGLAVLSDVFKTRVYEVAHRLNQRAGRSVIPESTLTKPPSAELRHDQKDTDSLPEYDILDPILQLYVEDGLDVEEIAATLRADRATVSRIVRMVDRNEYKRRQSAPGLRVSRKAFGVGRRMPIVMRFREVEPEPVQH